MLSRSSFAALFQRFGEADAQNLSRPLHVCGGAVGVHRSVAFQLKKDPQVLQTVGSQPRMGPLHQPQGIESLSFPERQPGPRQTLLQKSEVEEGVVRHQGAFLRQCQKLSAHFGEAGGAGHHLISDMVNRHRFRWNPPARIDQRLKPRESAIPVDPDRRKFDDPVVLRTHPGSLHVENREGTELVPDQFA